MFVRRTFRIVATLVLVALALPADRALAAYPDRIIKIIVPFAPGGGTDVVARALAQEMAQWCSSHAPSTLSWSTRLRRSSRLPT
jgi:tripartite-type tricarboxylate transporter receptor subunit TctC